MSTEELVRVAEECRKVAPEFRGRPEEPFLLRLASAFEELASRDEGSPRPSRKAKGVVKHH